MNPASKLGIVLDSEKEPWEYGTGGYFRVLEDGGKFKLCYGAFTEAGHSLCYAESTDGLHWTKPALDLVEVRGNKQNNLIFRDGAIDATVRWKGNSDLSALRDNPVTLHITGRAAKCAPSTSLPAHRPNIAPSLRAEARRILGCRPPSGGIHPIVTSRRYGCS